MTPEEREELKEIKDMLHELAPTIRALGRILIRRRTATKNGISESTFDHSDIKKFEEIGHKRTFIEIGEVAAIPQRKKKSR